MEILIAEDDSVSRRVLEATLTKWGHSVIAVRDGAEAWSALQCDGAPLLAILDWMMPEMDGIEVCHRVRHLKCDTPIYIILLTAKSSKEDIITGFDAGADDYLTKPFDREELRARVQVGARVVELQKSLAARVDELEEAISKVNLLQGILPMCSYCKKIRDDQNYWQRVESYISAHSDANFSHSICPDCYTGVVQPLIDQRSQSPEKHESEANKCGAKAGCETTERIPR